MRREFRRPLVANASRVDLVFQKQRLAG
jgi:hypothetical protein